MDKTVVGVLGTVGSWHRRAPRYGLRHLETLVRGFAPDLLCAEISRVAWEVARSAAFPPEYRECLLPLCRDLGVVVVPVGDEWRGPSSPLRLALLLGIGPNWMNSAAADRWHRAWARLGPNSEPVHRALAAHVLEAVQRDPGRRVLVTVRIERRYAVMDSLRQVDKVRLVSTWT